MKLHWPLTILFCMFLAPFLAALYLLSFGDQQNFNTVQHGKFIQPAQQLDPNLVKEHKWQLIYLLPDNCSARCHARRQTLNNLQIALGADQDRVVISSNYGKVINIDEKDDSILVVDPQGFYIMHFPPEAKLSGLLKDLKRLLKYSHAF